MKAYFIFQDLAQKKPSLLRNGFLYIEGVIYLLNLFTVFLL